MKTVSIAFIIILTLMMSCTFNTKKLKPKYSTTKIEPCVELVNSDSIAKKIVFEFYNWYTNDVYLKKADNYRIAPYKKYGENKYGLDIESYKRSLDSITFFSTSFKNFLIERSIKCSQDMLKETWDTNPKYEGSFNIPACACKWNIEWFGNHEDDNKKFSILETFTKKGSSYTFIVQNYIGETPAFKFEVKTIMEEGEYKIASINRQ